MTLFDKHFIFYVTTNFPCFRDQGNGFYNITLILATIAKEDVDRTYYLIVSNDLGRDEFAVRISTMDEPAGKTMTLGFYIRDM